MTLGKPQQPRDNWMKYLNERRQGWERGGKERKGNTGQRTREGESDDVWMVSRM